MDYSTILIVGAIAIPIAIGLAVFLRWLDKKLNGSQPNQAQKNNEQEKK